MILRPDGLSFPDWTARSIDLNRSLNWPIYRAGDWKKWAYEFLNINPYKDIPFPEYFDTWEEWVYAMMLSLGE